MLTLYDYLPSLNAYKIRLLLQHLGRPYRKELISIFEGEGQRDQFLSINPTGAVPAIKLENGNTLAESNAILMYLAEGSNYLSDDVFLRAKTLQWLFFEADYVQSTVATLRHWKLTGKDRNRPAELIAMKHAGSVKVLSILNGEFERNAFLGGDVYTIADMSVFAYVHRADEAGIPLSEFPNIERWVCDVTAQPHFLATVHPYSMDPHSTSELP